MARPYKNFATINIKTKINVWARFIQECKVAQLAANVTTRRTSCISYNRGGNQEISGFQRNFMCRH